ncbi:MAG: hypothetical protein RSE91_03945 [Bacilli bacterium]
MINNKGFAISTILYGLLMMASLVLFLLMATLANGKTANNHFVETIEKELNNCINNRSC